LAARERALGGVEIVEDSSVDAWRTARKLAANGRQVVIDTAGFRSQATLACIAAADFLLVPVKASPLDIDRMLDTLNSLIEASGSRRPLFRCVLTQTTRDSVIAKHVRSELIEAGFPVLKTEMNNRVIYAEAALWGATPTLIEPAGAAAREIAAIAAEIDDLTGLQAAA
jgi:chromosome partitioning protein